MKTQRDKAAYAAGVIRTFLDETCGPYDWDDFTSCSLRDPLVDSIRLRASGVDLPVDADGQREQLLSIKPDAQCEAIAGAGHWVMYEGAQGYNQALLRALVD